MPPVHCSLCTRTAQRNGLCQSHNRRRRLYRLTPSQFADIASRHGGQCPICGRRDDLVIDHCHDTGRVRDLICRPCNTAVGWIERVGSARLQGVGNYGDARHLEYLARWSATQDGAA